MEIDRRTMLRMLAALATLESEGAMAATPSAADLAAFGRLSSVLTGATMDDPNGIAKVRAAFDTPARRASLRALVALVDATPAADLDAALKAKKLDGLANDIVSTWYSGVAGAAASQRVVLYLEALVWSAMPGGKPMGACGGPTDYWADPPVR